MDIHHLVSALPEIYQPIYGHPDLSTRTTRLGHDRLGAITLIYRALETAIRRPLRVLDLGCAQGFYSLNLAALGASVTGIDLQAANIDVCRALAAENPQLSVQFRQDTIENIALHIRPGDYDLVLGLSVFHHIVHLTGLPIVQEIISILTRATMAGIYEIALAGEATLRGAAQPDDPRDVLAKCAFVHEVTHHPTHLEGIARPLYVASNFGWVLGEQAGRFDKWMSKSHKYKKDDGSRRYFIGDGVIAKLFRLDRAEVRDLNLAEYANEVALLSQPPVNFKTPRLRAHGHHANEAWLVRDYVSGDLLLDYFHTQKSFDAKIVLQDVLAQLASLEQAGLYHNDLRVWNILIAPDGRASLIDYGAVAKEKKDRGWPYDIFFSFMIFMRDVLAHEVSIPEPIREPACDPDSFAEPYRSMLWRLYQRDPADWSFTFMYDCLCDPEAEAAKPGATSGSLAAVTKIIENACAIYRAC